MVFQKGPSGMAQSENGVHDTASSVREMIESIWIAIVLAFVLRAFVLEAFVIPTGSMAPRLMGRHWQFDCGACKYHFAHGIMGATPGSGYANSGIAPCPNCRNQLKVSVGRSGGPWPFGGDRVLVLKYLYRFREPAPWDVVVFKNPLDNQQNYIKRLIGLPGQMLEIVHGDIFFRQGEDINNDGRIDRKDFARDPKAEKFPWRILEKSAKTQKVMWQPVFDNDYQPDGEYRVPDGAPWRPLWHLPEGSEGWSLDEQGGRLFRFTGSQRARLSFGRERPGDTPGQRQENRKIDRLRFCPVYGYNDPGRTNGTYDPDTDVNSDLKLSFTFVPQDADARVGLYLSSFDRHFRAWVGADGRCALEYRLAEADDSVPWDSDWQAWVAPRDDLPPLQLGRGHEIALTHVEHCVTLWIDGKEILKTTEKVYKADKELLTRKSYNKFGSGGRVVVPTPSVGILAEGGGFELQHVKVMRDVFYTNATIDATPSGESGHGTTGNPIVLRKFLNNRDMDEFFVLGDNSPQSKDSRMWGESAETLRDRGNYRLGTVPRYNIMGKAFFVYWPGGYPIPFLRPLPRRNVGIVPNVGQMRLIR